MIRDGLAKDFPEVASAEPVFEPPRAGDVLHSQASIEKISSLLGYQPTHQVADGMAETVQWFAQRLRKS
jgi:UDP-N-acetylglucosamine 4-epimerase